MDLFQIVKQILDGEWREVRMILASLIILTMVFLVIYTRPIKSWTRKERYAILAQRSNRITEKQTTKDICSGTLKTKKITHVNTLF